MAAAVPVFAGLSLAGTALGTMGQLQASQYQASVHARNAEMAEANAGQVEAATEDRLDQLARKTSITLGKQRAGYAFAGVKREGTPMEVLTETVTIADRDAHRIATEGRFAADSYRYQANELRTASKQVKRAGYFAAGTTLLSGLGNLGTSMMAGKAGSLGGSPLLS